MSWLLLPLFIFSIEAFDNSFQIEPKSDFHDMTKNLIITCNVSNVKIIPVLMYKNKENNYTILPRMNSENPNTYIGMLSANHTRHKINILCINEVTEELLSSKIYFFGYSPSMVLKDDFIPKLKCRDYNLRRVICCYSPTFKEISVKLGLVKDHDGNLEISLYHLISDELIPKIDDSSCFNLKFVILTPSLSVRLFIKNDLGNVSFDFSFTRFNILKPETPKIVLKPKSATNLTLVVHLPDSGEFVVNYTCFSDSSKYIIQVNEKRLTEQKAEIQLAGFRPNSKVTCTLQSQIMLESSRQGDFSEKSFSSLTLPESYPSSAPIVFPSLMSYQSVSNDQFLMNVEIYFLDIPFEDRNGLITKYMWKCQDCIHNREKVSNQIQEIDKTSRKIVLDMARLTSMFYITSCTAVGCALNWASLEFIDLPVRPETERIFLIESIGKPNPVNILWYLTNTMIERYHSILICYGIYDPKVTDENICRSIQRIRLPNTLIGKMSIPFNNLRVLKFALFDYSYQIKWNYCIYKMVSMYETKGKLSDLKIDRFFKSVVKCSMLKCSTELTITVPTCTEIPVLIISGVLISLESQNNKFINFSRFDLTTDRVSFVTNDLETDSYYNLRISFVDHTNETWLWKINPLVTHWWSWHKFLAIMIAIFMVLIVLTALLIYYGRKISDSYIKRDKTKFNNNVYWSASVEEYPSQPLRLNNEAANESNFLTFERYFSEGEHANSDIYDTIENSIYTKVTETTGSSCEGSEERLIFTTTTTESVITDNSESYVERPEKKPSKTEFKEEYINLVVEVNKNPLARTFPGEIYSTNLPERV